MGWPMRSLYGYRFYQSWQDASRPPLNHYVCLSIGPRDTHFTNPMQEERWLPYLPLWPGFAVNTALYPLIVWLFVRSVTTARYVSRGRFGRCPKCGYDLRGNLPGGCPECGWNREEAAACGRESGEASRRKVSM